MEEAVDRETEQEVPSSILFVSIWCTKCTIPRTYKAGGFHWFENILTKHSSFVFFFSIAAAKRLKDHLNKWQVRSKKQFVYLISLSQIPNLKPGIVKLDCRINKKRAVCQDVGIKSSPKTANGCPKSRHSKFAGKNAFQKSPKVTKYLVYLCKKICLKEL